MSTLQGVFLDFYGTLAAGDRRAVEAICEAVIADLGLPAEPAAFGLRWGHAYFAAIGACDGHGANGNGFRLLREIEHDTLVETVGGYGASIEAGPYIDRLNDYLACPPLFEEVREVLDGLAGRGLPVCIVSNADERELRAALRHHRLDVACVVSSESARSYKPQARIFCQALEETGWSADRVIHVGDSLHSDVGGARRVGIRTAWVERADRIGDIGTETPDVRWTDLKPLVELGCR